MKINKLFFVLFLASLFAVVTFAAMPQTVGAQPLVCGIPGSPPCPPSGGGGGSNKPGPKNHPTPIPPPCAPLNGSGLSPLPICTPAPSPCWEGSGANVHNNPDCTPTPPVTSGEAGPSNPNSELPAIQNPGQPSSPFNLPGLLGSIIAILLILGGLFFGVLLPAIQKRSPDDGSDKMGAQPHMNEGADQFLKFEDNPSSQFSKASDQFLKFEGSASELPPGPPTIPSLGSMPPGPPVKPPSPNIGDKSGGSTL